MKPDYKNWIPKGMLFSLIAGTVLSLALLLVFGVFGIGVSGKLRVVLGVVFGIGAALVVNLAAAFPIYIQPWSVVLSFAVCTVTGVFFGWYPAKKAAQLDPIEAIRYE